MSYEQYVPYTPAETRYDKMPYRRCGRSGLKLPAISLGLWHNFGDITPFGTQQQKIPHRKNRPVAQENESRQHEAYKGRAWWNRRNPRKQINKKQSRPPFVSFCLTFEVGTFLLSYPELTDGRDAFPCLTRYRASEKHKKNSSHTCRVDVTALVFLSHVRAVCNDVCLMHQLMQDAA